MEGVRTGLLWPPTQSVLRIHGGSFFSFSQIQIGFTLVDRMYKAKNELNNCPFFVAPTKQESQELMSISQNLCHLTTNL